MSHRGFVFGSLLFSALALGACGITGSGSGGSGGEGGGFGGGDGGGGGTNPATCTYDFDCLVGFTCEEATAAGGAGGAGGAILVGECVTAGAADERTFGLASFEVTADTDIFLMAVYDVPTEMEHAHETVFFTLNAGEADLNRTIRPLEFREPQPISREWRARLDFDRDRRTGINALVEDLRAGERTLWPAGGRQNAICDTPCSAIQMCWQGTCRAIETDTFDITYPLDGVDRTFQLADVLIDVASGLELNVVVEDSLWAERDTAILAAQGFLLTLPFQLDLLGQTGHVDPLDRDADGRMTVVVSNGVCPDQMGQVTCDAVDTCAWDATEAACRPSMAGFFAFTDFLPHTDPDPDTTGNEADILWAAMPLAGDEHHLTGTLAHEYTHLTSFAVRVQARNDDALPEVLWLDEGLAHLNEDLTGWGASNVRTIERAFDEWDFSGFANSDPGDSELTMRGKAMLLLRHMIDQASTGADAASTGTFDAATTLISGLLEGDAQGFDHAAFQDADPDFLWHHLLGLYATNNPDVNVTAANAYDYLPTAVHPEHAGTTNYITGIDPFGNYDDSLGGNTDFYGPVLDTAREDFDLDFELPYDDEIYRTGAVYYLLDTSAVTPGTFITIHATSDANLDLRLAVQKVQE